MKKLPILLSVLAIALATGLVACGGDDDDSSSTTAASTESTPSGGGGTVSFTADPDGQLAYTETEVTASAGENTIELDNPASLTHDVVIEDTDGNEIAATEQVAGETTSTTADLEAGTFTFYCSVDSHREAGMEGTLTVE